MLKGYQSPLQKTDKVILGIRPEDIITEGHQVHRRWLRNSKFFRISRRYKIKSILTLEQEKPLAVIASPKVKTTV